MRLILLALLVLVAVPARAAELPGNLHAHLVLAETLLEDGKAQQAKEAILKVKQGSTAYDPPEGQRVQEWAKKVEAAIEEELK